LKNFEKKRKKLLRGGGKSGRWGGVGGGWFGGGFGGGVGVVCWGFQEKFGGRGRGGGVTLDTRRNGGKPFRDRREEKKPHRKVNLGGNLWK